MKSTKPSLYLTTNEYELFTSDEQCRRFMVGKKIVVYDNAGNTYGTEYVNGMKCYIRIDKTAPTITVNNTTCSYRNSGYNVTITAEDPLGSAGGASGLSSSNNY